MKKATYPIRHRLSCATTLLLLALFLCFSAAHSSGQQIANGNFESGHASGWNHLAGGGGSATYSDETTAPYQGLHALKVVVASLGTNSWDIQSLGPTVSLVIGEEYTLSFWGKAASDQTTVSMIIQNIKWTGSSHSLNTGWIKYSWTFIAQEISPSLRIQYTKIGSVWLDDIQLEAVVPHVGPVGITLAPQTRHQTMVGFGGCLSWYADWVYNGTEANAAEIETLLYQDLGLDVIRFKNNYYPTDYPTNKIPTSVMWEKEYAAAKAGNPDIQVLLSSWSPPANLKSNGERPNGGTLTKDGSGNYQYAELAQYWVDLLDHLTWSPDYLSFQNEPGYVATWDSCIFRPTETVENAGYAEAADAIWNAIKDRPNTPKMLGSEAENIGNATWPDWNGGNPVNTFEALNTPLLERPYIAAHGYHLYNIWDESVIDSATTFQQLNMVRDSFGDRPNWMTEYSGSDWLGAARVIHNTMTEANAEAYIMWAMVWNNTIDNSVIGVEFDGTYNVGNKYYTLKHYAKHIDKGYQRVEVSGSTANVKVSGYLSPDKESITLVAINKNTEAEQISLNHSLSISEIAGYQSVIGNLYQTIPGLDAANPIDLPAESLTTVVLTLLTPYKIWAGGEFNNTFLDNDPSNNPDGDSMNNLLEFAFGTDPTLSDSGSLVVDGSVNGQPRLISSDGGNTFDFLYVRRNDHGTSGSLTYTPQFSNDLVTYYDSSDSPTLVIDSTDDADYEVVKVPYPATLPDGKEARFARMKIDETP